LSCKWCGEDCEKFMYNTQYGCCSSSCNKIFQNVNGIGRFGGAGGDIITLQRFVEEMEKFDPECDCNCCAVKRGCADCPECMALITNKHGLAEPPPGINHVLFHRLDPLDVDRTCLEVHFRNHWEIYKAIKLQGQLVHMIMALFSEDHPCPYEMANRQTRLKLAAEEARVREIAKIRANFDRYNQIPKPLKPTTGGFMSYLKSWWYSPETKTCQEPEATTPPETDESLDKFDSWVYNNQVRFIANNHISPPPDTTVNKSERIRSVSLRYVDNTSNSANPSQFEEVHISATPEPKPELKPTRPIVHEYIDDETLNPDGDRALESERYNLAIIMRKELGIKGPGNRL
jgi:hypothetical protein